ncbi:MAG: carboxylesterase/lipase family protein, partial [Pseudomonadota bacterium]
MKRSFTDDRMQIDRRTFSQGLLAAATAAIWAPLAESASPISADAVATTRSGKIRGTRQGNISAFKGVPYGANTAKTRFMKCAPPPPWTGERDATRYGAQMPQATRPYTGARALLQSWDIPQEMSEDCLFLNVWTPGLRDKKKRAVMVYIHGGGFTAGSGATNGYDGTRLAQRGDVVVLTLNHRLNIFGFLYLGQLGGEQYADSGNAGMHDLITALRWVRDNIEEFGGDPGNVLIFGESGGGMKICTLLAMPEAQGLFHRGVAQSGQMVWGTQPDEATEAAREVLGLLNISSTNLTALNDVTTDQLHQAFTRLSPRNALKFAPVVDGRGLPRHPFDPTAPAMSAGVPLLIGTTRTETTWIFSRPEFFALTWEEVAMRLKPFAGDMDCAAIVQRYREIDPKSTPSDVFFAATTHLMMSRNVVTIADRKSALKAAPVYRYELVWETPVDGGKWHSPHTLDIALVFDNVANSASVFGGSPDAQKLADQMSEAWLAFAKKGDPNNATLPAWAPYDAIRRQTMRFDVKSYMIDNPHGEEIAALGSAPPWNA